jgi:methionyl aminopeptidase
MKLWKTHGYKIYIKEQSELKSMREGGKILGQILFELEKLIAPGITSFELDQKAESMMQTFGVKPSFKGYQGFPSTLCVSVNEQIVHGIPNKQYEFREGDIVTIDCGVFYKNFHTDSAITVPVGKINQPTTKFVTVTKQALEAAIKIIKPGLKISEISSTIQNIVEKEGYSVIRELTGHGIGENIHEDPPILNFVSHNPEPELAAGMTIAVEPIISMGKPKIMLLKDGWTYVTKDGSLSAQQEHTILVTQTGAEILTKRPNE